MDVVTSAQQRSAPRGLLRVLLLARADDRLSQLEQSLLQHFDRVRLNRAETRSSVEHALDISAADVVLADENCLGPDISAWLAALRQRHPETPLIVLATKPSPKTVIGLMRAGAHDCVPVSDMDALSAAVQRSVTTAQAIRAQLERQVASAPNAERFQKLIEATTDVIAVTQLDGTISYISPSIETISGYRPDELIGRDYLDFVDPQDLSKAQAQLAELARQPGTSQLHELCMLHKDGSRIEAESLVRNLSDVPGIDGVVVNLRDVTWRKEAERQLQLANTLIEQSPAVLFRWLASPGWPIRYVSRNVAQWGYASDALLSSAQNYLELIYADDAERVIAATAAAVDAGAAELVLEYRLRTRAGEVRWVEENSKIERDANGAAMYFQGVVTDITQRKLAELARAESSARKRQHFDAIGVAGESPHLTSGAFDRYACQLTELCAHTTGVHRVSVWRFNEAQTELRCIDLFELASSRHSSGSVLKQAEFKNEFDALKSARYVDANDALTDPRTAGYVESYLKPLGITSMLDVVVQTAGSPPGLLCFECVDQAHHWTADEIAFAERIADKLGHCIANMQQRAALSELEEAQRVAHLGSWLLHLPTGAATWSPEIYRIFGLDPAGPAPDLAQQTELVEPQSFALLHTAIEECRTSGKGYRLELEILHPSRTSRWIEARGEAVRGADGTIETLRGTAQDITERKQAQEALRSSQQVIEGILNAMPVRVFWKDRNLVYLGCNAEFARDAGYADPRDVIGKDDYQMAWREQADLYRGDDRSVIDSGRAKLLIEEPQTTADSSMVTLLTSKLPLRDAQGDVVGVLGTYMDITEHKRQALALARTTRALKALSNCNSVLVHALSEEQLYADMAQTLVESGGYKMAWVGLVESGEDQPIRPVGIAGDASGYVASARVSWGDNERGRGPSGQCVRIGAAVVSHDIATDPGMTPWHDAAQAAGFAASVALPLKDGDRVFGVLNLYAGDAEAFDDEELALLTEMAGDLAFGVITQRERSTHLLDLQRLERSMEATIDALASTVGIRDPYTAGHQHRVADIAVAIGTALGMQDAPLHGLKLAASVHDIGKLSIPAEILSKPGRLSPIEYALVQGHVEAGYEILKDVEFPWPVAEMVRQHHERIDGSGYPRGLKGEQILLEARIIAVADVVEAMASHRPYRGGKGLDAALDEIAAGRGKRFDPAVADACLKLFREQNFRIPD
jgi:PAS domain S-box-containing protein